MVLDFYDTAVKCEQAKLAKKSAKKCKSALNSNSNSDSEMSVNIIAETKPCAKSILKKKEKCADMLEEESTYQKCFQ